MYCAKKLKNQKAGMATIISNNENFRVSYQDTERCLIMKGVSLPRRHRAQKCVKIKLLNHITHGVNPERTAKKTANCASSK